MNPLNRTLTVSAIAALIVAYVGILVAIVLEISRSFEIPLNLDMIWVLIWVSFTDPVVWGMVTHDFLYALPAMFILAWLWEERW